MNFGFGLLPSNKTDNLSTYILDPLSVIVKLAILNNKPIGTKLVVDTNIIYFQTPGIFQGFCRRFVTFATKSDLTYLNNPIHLACIQFLSEESIKTHPSIALLFEQARKGLFKLSETYAQNDVIRITLFYYANTIVSYLKRKPSYIPAIMPDSISPLYTEIIVKKLHNQWTAGKIGNILNIMEYLTSEANSREDVAGLETFIVSIDQHTQDFLARPGVGLV